MASKRRPTLRELARQMTQTESTARRAFEHDVPEVRRPRSGKGYSLHEGNARMLATELGIDPDRAGAAGPRAAKILGALKDASDSDSAEKTTHMQRAQRHLAAMDPAKHGTFVRQVQAKLLALQGHGGDTEVAHVTPGEIVIPPQLQTPEILAALERAAAGAGLSLDQLRVGSGANRRNPKTGAPEFTPIESMTVTGQRSPGGNAFASDIWGNAPGLGFGGDELGSDLPPPRSPDDPVYMSGQLVGWVMDSNLPEDAKKNLLNVLNAPGDLKQRVNQATGLLAGIDAGNGTTNPLLASSPTWLQPLLNWSGYQGSFEPVGPSSRPSTPSTLNPEAGDMEVRGTRLPPFDPSAGDMEVAAPGMPEPGSEQPPLSQSSYGIPSTPPHLETPEEKLTRIQASLSAASDDDLVWARLVKQAIPTLGAGTALGLLGAEGIEAMAFGPAFGLVRPSAINDEITRRYHEGRWNPTRTER